MPRISPSPPSAARGPELPEAPSGGTRSERRVPVGRRCVAAAGVGSACMSRHVDRRQGRQGPRGRSCVADRRGAACRNRSGVP
eukprot:13841006-Alexandrium_andersonii.AAC.1